MTLPCSVAVGREGLNHCLTGMSVWDEGMILEADGDGSITIFWLYLITLHCIYCILHRYANIGINSVYLNSIYCIFETIKVGLGRRTAQSVQD